MGKGTGGYVVIMVLINVFKSTNDTRVTLAKMCFSVLNLLLPKIFKVKSNAYMFVGKKKIQVLVVVKKHVMNSLQ